MHFYDVQGKVTQASFNDAVYSYVHNFQGGILLECLTVLVVLW